MSDDLAAIRAELALQRLTRELDDLRAQHAQATHDFNVALENLNEVSDYRPDPPPPRELGLMTCGIVFFTLIAAGLALISSALAWRLSIATAWLIFLAYTFVVDQKERAGALTRNAAQAEHIAKVQAEARRKLRSANGVHDAKARELAVKLAEVERIRRSLS